MTSAQSKSTNGCDSQEERSIATPLLIKGDDRDLSQFEDDSIDGIITDHPYDLKKALRSSTRNFAPYELFRYESCDFAQKWRVLKAGAFLVEFLPEESEINFKYLYEIKRLAEECGFRYFAKVPWTKGSFVANTGRKSKNIEDVMFFSKGRPRALKLDAAKNLALARKYGLGVQGKSSYQVRDLLREHNLQIYFMMGTNGMLPTAFIYQPKSAKRKLHSAEKPVELIEEIIRYISKPREILLDQFAGSGNFVIACHNTQRSSIAIEKDSETFARMKIHVEQNTATSVSSEKGQFGQRGAAKTHLFTDAL